MQSTLKTFISRFGKKKRKMFCIPMQKCMINQSSTQRRFNNLSDSTTTQQSFSTSSELSSVSISSPPGHYNTLQFNYGTECNFHNSHVNHNGLSSVNVTSSNHHHNHNSNFQVHSDHSMTSFSQNTTSNSMLQDNGYVLPNSFTRESNMPTITNSQIKSADKNVKPTHKRPVILKEESDGSGIIQIGSLQAVIPSSARGHNNKIIKPVSLQAVTPPSRPPRNDENYRVIPSETHKSYFNVVKNT